MRASAQANVDLAGLRVLVVEDDYFIASEICAALRDRGVCVVGPAPDVESDLELLSRERIDCAVLDINLHGDLVFQLATELKRRGTPAIFASGYDGSIIPRELTGSTHLEKPINLTALLHAIRDCRTAGIDGEDVS